MNNLLKGILLGTIAQVCTFFQLQGQIKYEFFKNNPLVIAFMGVPISLLFMYSVRHFVEFADGAIWPSRLIGFSIGMIVFTVMSYFMFDEPITTKTFVCLMLGVAIMGIQIFWK